jgi:hypothetical protein
MKKKILIVIGLTIIAVIGISSFNEGRSINPLLKENIEALADDEWGGGHHGAGGEISWYDYEKVTYGWKTGKDIPLPGNDTLQVGTFWCETHTCQGYGDLFCQGYINCI